jgi:hypothetical protein
MWILRTACEVARAVKHLIVSCYCTAQRPGPRPACANDMQRWAMITTTAWQKQKIGQDKSPDWSRADPRLVLFWINSASPAPSARRIPLQILSYLGNRPLASEGASKPARLLPRQYLVVATEPGNTGHRQKQASSKMASHGPVGRLPAREMASRRLAFLSAAQWPPATESLPSSGRATTSADGTCEGDVPHASGLWARTVPHAARRASHSRRTVRTGLSYRSATARTTSLPWWYKAPSGRPACRGRRRALGSDAEGTGHAPRRLWSMLPTRRDGYLAVAAHGGAALLLRARADGSDWEDVLGRAPRGAGCQTRHDRNQ